MGISSFRYKLWNWEQFSSQKSELSPALPLTNCGNKTFHLEGQKTTGLAHRRPEKGPEATGVQTLPPQSRMMVQRKSPVASEPSPLPLPQHSRKSTESPGAEGSPGSSPCQPVYECELTSLVPGKKSSPSPHGTQDKTIVPFSPRACRLEVNTASAMELQHGYVWHIG